jgi:hypothetical protein
VGAGFRASTQPTTAGNALRAELQADTGEDATILLRIKENVMIKIEGLDKLQRQLTDAQKAIKNLENESIDVRFDPHDAASVEAAIQQTMGLIDERVSVFASNPFVVPLVEQFKEASRTAILERATKARLQTETK